MIVRRSFSEACRDGDLIAIVRDLFTIRRRGQLIDVPFHRLTGAEVIELAEALHVAADEIAAHGAERLVSRADNVVELREWR